MKAMGRAVSARLSTEARAVGYAVLLILGRKQRISANPLWIASQVCPAERVDTGQFRASLRACVDAGLFGLEQQDGEWYIVRADPRTTKKRASDVVREPYMAFPVCGVDGAEWTLDATDYRRWVECYPGIDVAQALRGALAWIEANPSHRKTARGMKSFLVRWLNRETNARPTRSVGAIPESREARIRGDITGLLQCLNTDDQN